MLPWIDVAILSRIENPASWNRVSRLTSQLPASRITQAVWDTASYLTKQLSGTAVHPSVLRGISPAVTPSPFTRPNAHYPTIFLPFVGRAFPSHNHHEHHHDLPFLATVSPPRPGSRHQFARSKLQECQFFDSRTSACTYYFPPNGNGSRIYPNGLREAPPWASATGGRSIEPFKPPGQGMGRSWGTTICLRLCGSFRRSERRSCCG